MTRASGTWLNRQNLSDILEVCELLRLKQKSDINLCKQLRSIKKPDI